MRAVTFVDRLSLEVEGTVAQHGVCLGDVDSDGQHELVVGTEAGELLVFKGASGTAWLRCSDLGFITALGIGDLLGIGHSVLVVASGCGWLHIFDLSCCPGPGAGEEGPRPVAPIHTQRVPANVKDLILCAVTGRGGAGRLELVVSLTDRVVRTYRWERQAAPEEEEGGPAPLAPAAGPGRLVSVNKWEFASQIGTVTCNIDSDGRPALLVAQPGGAYMKLKEAEPGAGAGGLPKDASSPGGMGAGEGEPGEGGPGATAMSVEYEPLGVNRRRNRNVSAEILGGFRSRAGGPGTRYAIVTLDGTVLLVDQGSKDPMDSIMWNLQVDHQLMCLSKLDVTGDGLQEVIACSWDGQTYIISQDRQAVRFQFEESVSTFTAGLYSLEQGGPPVPALVYVTFTGRIQLYHNLGLDRGITLSSLVHCPGMVDEASDMLARLGVDSTDMKQLQQVYSYCLYGMPRHLRPEEKQPEE